MPSDHRLHPSSILFALAGSLRAFLLPAVLLVVTSGRSSPESSDRDWWNPVAWANRSMPGDVEIANWQFWILLLLIPATIAAVLRYVSFRLRYEGTELVIRSGVLFRNERHIPYERIQNLDAIRNVAHRFFGVAEVRVETGAGQAPEATISVLQDAVFDEMRRRVFEGRRQGTHDRPEPAATERGTVPEIASKTLLHLPVRELLLNGLLDNRGLVVIAAGAGVLWDTGLLRVVSDQLAGSTFQRGLVRETVRELMSGDVLAFLVGAAILAIGILLVLALVRVLSIAWSVVRLHDFRLSRVGEDLRTQYGLLTRVTATIPLRRVQSLTIRESPLQRLVKRKSVRVDTAGGHGHPHDGRARRPREMLAPLIRTTAVPALVREVLPGFELDTLEWQTLHPRAFRRAVKPALAIAVVAALPFVGWFGWRGLLMLFVTVPWVCVATSMSVKHTRWAYSDDSLIFRSGWLWREVVVVPIAKIQVIGRVQSPFDRRAAMAGVRIDTAGSGSPVHRISVHYLGRDTATALYERLAAQTAQTAFRW